jgi:tRNA A37 threonylcarbamoyladenosine dehydratase
MEGRKKIYRERFAGIDRLYGRGAGLRLGDLHVAVVGLGGVGSWAVEALARSGVGRLTLIDADDICLSNTSRQLHALDGHYGRNKGVALEERAVAINPTIAVEVVQEFLIAANLEAMLARGFDLVIDACDSVRSKLDLVVACKRRKLPLVVVGSAGGRTDPTLVRVRDLSRTEHDALLALMRKRLRADHGFPRNADRYFGIPAVYSMENVKYPHPDGSVSGVRPGLEPAAAFKLDCGGGLGSATHVTGAFAFAAVGRGLELLLKKPVE